tara:strand:+ start:47794 stop:48978 length:1185 start_codon:yes stop_codon:yes gene_type:complete
MTKRLEFNKLNKPYVSICNIQKSKYSYIKNDYILSSDASYNSLCIGKLKDNYRESFALNKDMILDENYKSYIFTKSVDPEDIINELEKNGCKRAEIKIVKDIKNLPLSFKNRTEAILLDLGFYKSRKTRELIEKEHKSDGYTHHLLKVLSYNFFERIGMLNSFKRIVLNDLGNSDNEEVLKRVLVDTYNDIAKINGEDKARDYKEIPKSFFYKYTELKRQQRIINFNNIDNEEDAKIYIIHINDSDDYEMAMFLLRKNLINTTSTFNERNLKLTRKTERNFFIEYEDVLFDFTIDFRNEKILHTHLFIPEEIVTKIDPEVFKRMVDFNHLFYIREKPKSSNKQIEMLYSGIIKNERCRSNCIVVSNNYCQRMITIGKYILSRLEIDLEEINNQK